MGQADCELFHRINLALVDSRQKSFRDRLEKASRNPMSVEIIDDLLAALDSGKQPEARCRAIDALLNAQVRLPTQMIQGLLSTQERAVRMFALGLIPYSEGVTRLMAEVARRAEESDDAEFRLECVLLCNLAEVQ